MKFLLYIRGLVLTPLFILHTFFCSIVVASLLLFRFPRRVVDLAVGPLWCGFMVWLSGARIVTLGKENVPRDSGFLYLFTHSSLMDIPILFVASPKSLRFGAKYSLFKIPIFGTAIRLSGTLPITRDDPAKVFEVYRQAEERVRNGEAFALAPEGGRRDGDEIKAFKSGPFFFAINAKMPIVPVVLCGVDRVMPNGHALMGLNSWTKKIAVQFLPPVSTEGLTTDDVKDLKEKVRVDVVREFEALKKEFH